jgi:hypothetical protein
MALPRSRARLQCAQEQVRGCSRNAMNEERRRLLQLTLSALPTLALGEIALAEPQPSAAAGISHDFDFFFGEWRVHHRRLKRRLVQADDWEEFEGVTKCQPLLGGLANLNDSLVHRPSGPTRGMGLRAFNAATNTWGDWYLDGRDPTRIEVHGVGRFERGVATFYADDVFEGKAVKVRGVWSHIATSSFQWEQAYSPDAGRTWETNYVMRQIRTA